MATNLAGLDSPVVQFFDDNGKPLANGLVYTYLAGSSTPIPTYQDIGGTVPNQNPTLLSASGKAVIYLGLQVYKFDVRNTSGIIFTLPLDPLNPIGVSISGYPRDNIPPALGGPGFSIPGQLLLGGVTGTPPVDLSIGLPYTGVIYSKNHDNNGWIAMLDCNPLINTPGGTNHGNNAVMIGDTNTPAVTSNDDTTTKLGDANFRWSQLNTGGGAGPTAPAWCSWSHTDPFSDANYDRFALYNDGTFYWLIAQAGGTYSRQNIRLSAPVVAIDGRDQRSLGANTGSANNLTLPSDGNSWHITGNVQINAITVANWQAGSEVVLIFTGTPTVKHNTAGGAGTAPILLSGAADFVAAANNTLSLLYDGTNWFETARKV